MMLRLCIALVLLLQVALIGWSAQLLMTGGTALPGIHVALIFVNSAFGLFNVYNLMRA